MNHCKYTHHSYNQLVKVDHFAFTAKLSDFRHLELAGRTYSKEMQWTKLPRESYKNYEDASVRYDQLMDYQAELEHVCVIRAREFAEKILGLKCGQYREKGLFGYKDSCHLLDPTGRHQLGFMAVGGNNDTVYFQITGTGCEHVFEKISPRHLHFWLSEILQIINVSRIDLCYDDFTGNFDTNYAKKAYDDEAFQNPRGGQHPSIRLNYSESRGKVTGDTVYIGNRQSKVMWRIYDKALEQGLEDTCWYRTEVELKKFPVEVLKDPALAFCGLCAFANSFANNKEREKNAVNLRRSVVRVKLDFAGKMRWAKRQFGPTLQAIIEHLNGDIESAVDALTIKSKTKFEMPDNYRKLLNIDIDKLEIAT